MQFIAELQHILMMAKNLLPLIAFVNPNASAGVNTADAVISAVKPLVDAGEAISQQAVASGQPALTGVQKLALAQSAVQSAISMAQQSGLATKPFDEHWAVINPAITAICAASKQPQA